MTEARDEARALMIQGCERWIEQFDETGVVTGWITIIEYVLPNGHSIVQWATGDGMPTKGDSGWISAHKFRGMLEEVRSELDAAEVVRQLKANEDE